MDPALSADLASPAAIRALRGSATRAAFAARLGVTAQTVYRWELPPESAESRRPRGAVLQRLRALGGASPAALESRPSSSDSRPYAPREPRPDSRPLSPMVELPPE